MTFSRLGSGWVLSEIHGGGLSLTGVFFLILNPLQSIPQEYMNTTFTHFFSLEEEQTEPFFPFEAKQTELFSSNY